MDELRPQDPARIGAWRILARLGAGGMGQVYLGRSPGGRLVAVKVIRDEISDHPETLARFRREAATVETVRSAYTAQLIEASLDEPPYWLATEYVPGPTLRDAVRAGGPFPAESASRLLAALAEGLAAVHVHGVTHRDLKPQNVILAPQGPQLIDFGIARGFEQTVLTRDGMAPGTPGYAAPEVLLRNEVGPAADVFALGATIAFTATGRPPYGAGDAAAVSYRTVHEDIDVTGVRPGLAALIRRCVAKDPRDRPDLPTVIAACDVDSPLAADAHYRAVARDDTSLPGHVLPPPQRSGERTTSPSTRPEPRTGGHVSSPRRPAPRPESAAPDSPRTTAGMVSGHHDAPRAKADRVPGGPTSPAPADMTDASAAGPTVRDATGPTSASGRSEPSGTEPHGDPGPERHHARRARRTRRTPWLAVCAVALAVPVTTWLLLPDRGDRDDRDGASATPARDVTASTPTTSGSPAAARPPDHILNDRVSRDRWALSDDPAQAAQGIGSCDLGRLADSSPPMDLRSSVSHTTGSDTASVSLRPTSAGKGKRPAPYYVSVGVRPPHETDRVTGRPLRSDAEGIGFTSKPVDIYSRWSSGGTIELDYPGDFQAHFGKRTLDAIPVGDDRGDWTVVLYHVEGGPTKYTSVLCNGFHA
ncbi:protein kinase domain-containing protein [Streptomyces sp. NPDC054842]